MTSFAPHRTVLPALFVAAALFARPASAQQPGACRPALADNYLYINNVRARILNNGGLFYRGEPYVYEIPRGSGVNAIFAASFWVGGFVDDQLRVAAARYGRYEFWPGPLTEGGALPDPDDCSAFDRIYKISRADLLLFDQTGEATRDLRDWPWHLGAPVADGDGMPGNYNLDGGDRPAIRGHQMLWWVMNDVGNVHEQTESPPLGLEVQATAFAAASDIDALNNTTFYHYKLINRTPAPIEQAYVGVFADPDLGNFADDHVGSDTTLGLAFVYNADDFDEGGGGYGEAPPAAGITFLQGPLVNDDALDNDRDGQTDEADERLGMTSFMFYNGGGCVTCDPERASDYYNYMKALWKDGRPVTLGGNGRDFSETPTTFFFPGDPVTGAYWSERNMNNQGTPIDPGDRRFITSMGPFTLRPGEAQDVVFAVVWARRDRPPGLHHRATRRHPDRAGCLRRRARYDPPSSGRDAARRADAGSAGRRHDGPARHPDPALERRRKRQRLSARTGYRRSLYLGGGPIHYIGLYVADARHAGSLPNLLLAAPG